MLRPISQMLHRICKARLDFLPWSQTSRHWAKKANVAHHRRDYEICMVFPYKVTEEAADAKADLKKQMMQHERESVMKNLQQCGLHIHCFYSRDRDEIFCKIGAGAKKLRDTAARIKYKLQLKPEYLNAYAEYRSDFPGRPEHGYKDKRMVNHIYKTFTHDDFPSEDAIFSTRDKITLVHYIISAKDKDCAGINVGKMLHTEELKFYFPLHEETIVRELGSKIALLSWLQMNPEFALNVRDYFGEKVALYFLFMSFYWKAWLVPAVLGVLVQMCDVLFMTPDNITAVPFCIFISVWSVLLPHFWKRQETKFAVQWGTLDLVPELETYRPQFYGEQRINPVTNQVEPFYPWRKRAGTYVLSLSCILVTAILCSLCMLTALWARHLTKDMLPDNVRSNRIIIFQIGLAILVEITNSVFTTVAERLTDMENHRTQTEYERHLLIKVMVFKFVNSYFVLYYIAFLKKPLNLFGMMCWRNDCMLDLQGQLFSFVVVRLTISNATEFLFPKLVYYCRGFAEKRKAIFHNLSSYQKLEVADLSSAEAQSKKELHQSFSEFDEVLISHGYASLFAVSSPWVCLATLLWVGLESVLDVKTLCESKQRPLPQKVRNNEPWDTAFEIYGYLAAATNITLLVFASSQFSGNSAVQKLFLWLFLLHLIMFFKIVTNWLLPEIPRSVEMLKLKQDQKAHMALSNIKMEPAQDFTMMRHQRIVNPPVREQDHHDHDAEDPEPHLSFAKSRQAIVSGVKETQLKIVVLLFGVAVIVGLFTWACLLLQLPFASS
mmetsp:Transcript_102855/g.160464  ORF Transcript_102855/g.160464 Transcript_102855/m.160464 type:complete len:777 (+) Transcript_102855:320-2650(+)